MIAVIVELTPAPGRKQDYLDLAAGLAAVQALNVVRVVSLFYLVTIIQLGPGVVERPRSV